MGACVLIDWLIVALTSACHFLVCWVAFEWFFLFL